MGNIFNYSVDVTFLSGALEGSSTTHTSYTDRRLGQPFEKGQVVKSSLTGTTYRVDDFRWEGRR